MALQMEVSFPKTSDLEVFDDWRMTDLSTIDRGMNPESHDVNRQSVTDDAILKRMNSEELMDCMCVDVASLQDENANPPRVAELYTVNLMVEKVANQLIADLGTEDFMNVKMNASDVIAE